MIKINKQLNRTDGGVIASGSVTVNDYVIITEKKIVVFKIKHYLNETKYSEGYPPIPKISNFDYLIKKNCSEEEWDSLADDPNTSSIIEGWLKDIIDSKIGAGHTEIIQ